MPSMMQSAVNWIWGQLYSSSAAAPAEASERSSAPLAGAGVDRLTADWILGDLSTDEKIRQSLPTLRRRARDLADNDPYNVQFLRQLDTNVIGANGIRLQMAAKYPNGDEDEDANERVEAAWKDFGRLGVPTSDGELDMVGLQKQIIAAVATDGEVLLRWRKGWDNGHGLAVQVVEAQFLDETYTERRPDGAQIVMGVEYDAERRRRAYYLRTFDPGDKLLAGVVDVGRRVRVPAEEMAHIFVRRKWRQTRGIPWINAALLNLRHIGAYEKAAVIAARAGAMKLGFFQQASPTQTPPGKKDVNANVVDQMQPGETQILPPGMEFKGFDPGYPTGDFKPFIKAMLQGIASNFGSNYATLASDLDGINYSALRHGTLEEREAWQVLQGWLKVYVVNQIFVQWLPQAYLAGQLGNVRLDLVERWIKQATWQARGWSWVDPLKDVQAEKEALSAGLTTRQAICARRGLDYQDVLKQLAKEQELARQLGVVLESPNPTLTEALLSEPDPDERQHTNGVSHHATN